MAFMTPLEKSIALRLIRKRKESLDVLSTLNYLSADDLKGDREALLEEVVSLKEMIDPNLSNESWMLDELDLIERQLTEREILQGSWDSLLKKNCGRVIEVLEKRYRAACNECNAVEMEETLYLIRVLKKQLDGEIGKNIIEGTSGENVILFNNQINNISKKNNHAY